MKVYKCTPQGTTFKDAAGEVIINKHSLDWRHHGGVSGCLLIEEHASWACLSRRRGVVRGVGVCVAEQQRSISSYTTRTRRCGSTDLIRRYHVELLEDARAHPRARGRNREATPPRRDAS